MRILAVSPHLDDAIFSAGGTLAAHAQAGDEVTVLTCFTGNVDRPTGFALACQLDKGLGPHVDYMALRRAEDERACALIGAKAIHWPFLEAPHRGYESAAALFADVRRDDDIARDLGTALSARLRADMPDRVYAPFGVGGHVDHLAVRAAVMQMRSSAPVIWWEDYPYAMRQPSPPPAIVRRPIDARNAQRKLRAVLAYESQLGFQFGGRDEARSAMTDWKYEGFGAAPPVRDEVTGS